MQVAGAGDPMRRLKAFATASICGHIATTSLGVMSACIAQADAVNNEAACYEQAVSVRVRMAFWSGFMEDRTSVLASRRNNSTMDRGKGQGWG